MIFGVWGSPNKHFCEASMRTISQKASIDALLATL